MSLPAVYKELIHYDPETGIFTRKKAAGHQPIGAICGCINPYSGYRQISVGGKVYFAHRLAWFLMYGVWPRELDHINGSKDDNRIANLRVATRSQNMTNSGRSAKNRSGFKGVHYAVKSKKWQAKIRVNKQHFNLGYFNSPQEAYAAYVEACLRLCGEFARIE